MKLKILSILIFSFFGYQSHAVTNGLSLDLKNGIGYTIFLDRLWGGISLNAFERRFIDNQMVINPRIYANYNVCSHENLDFFVGADYSDDFGTRNDSTIDKHRLLAFNLGMTAKLTDKFRLSGWVNLWGVRDDLIYNSTAGARQFDTDANRQSFMDFGGLLLTYLF
jgi:hypothetical protein